MMLIRNFFLLSALLFAIQVQAYPGFRQITFSELNMAVWYPTSAEGIKESAGENPAFAGVTVIRDAAPLAGIHPLLVISHGYNGNWRSLSWIAAAMAAQGYIVAAPDHPGTTTFNQNPVEAKKLWRRPQDIARVIDFVINSPEQFGEADSSRIAALGHSLGGWTVMSLAGARFSPELFIQDCQQYSPRGDCNAVEKLGLNNLQSHEQLSASRRDTRISAVVSLDLGFAPGFTAQSLHEINIPVLILAAQEGKLAELPAEQESAWLADRIRTEWRQFEIIKGATHFSFMQLCKPGAEILINEASPGEGIICQDGPGGKRVDIHQGLVEKIGSFLNSSLNYHLPAGEIR